MLVLSNINYTIWRFNGHEWSIEEALQGTHEEAKARTNELKALHPYAAFGLRTNRPTHQDGHLASLKKAHMYGHVAS